MTQPPSKTSDPKPQRKPRELSSMDLVFLQNIADGSGIEAAGLVVGWSRRTTNLRIKRAKEIYRATTTYHLLAELVRKGIID